MYVFYCVVFQDFEFTLIISWLFQGTGKDIPCNDLMI